MRLYEVGMLRAEEEDQEEDEEAGNDSPGDDDDDDSDGSSSSMSDFMDGDANGGEFDCKFQHNLEFES